MILLYQHIGVRHKWWLINTTLRLFVKTCQLFEWCTKLLMNLFILSQTFSPTPSCSVSFGCSDLHGDGRVHEQTGPEGPSGFGFELTMRLKREEGEKSPPTWPAAIMQALAKYVFQSGLDALSFISIFHYLFSCFKSWKPFFESRILCRKHLIWVLWHMSLSGAVVSASDYKSVGPSLIPDEGRRHTYHPDDHLPKWVGW